MAKALELTNKRFGRLVVIKRVDNNKFGSAMWQCRCDCGNTITASGKMLNYGQTKCCGCLRYEKNWLPKGEAGINHNYHVIKGNAKRRGKDFNLSKKEFELLTTSNCFYCGATPSQLKTGTNKAITNGHYLANGIDRTNPLIGYTIDNCKPCCWVCNRAKGSLLEDEFLSWVKNLYNHQFGKLA